jgi:hypothetical protein
MESKRSSNSHRFFVNHATKNPAVASDLCAHLTLSMIEISKNVTVTEAKHGSRKKCHLLIYCTTTCTRVCSTVHVQYSRCISACTNILRDTDGWNRMRVVRTDAPSRLRSTWKQGIFSATSTYPSTLCHSYTFFLLSLL